MKRGSYIPAVALDDPIPGVVCGAVVSVGRKQRSCPGEGAHGEERAAR